MPISCQFRDCKALVSMCWSSSVYQLSSAGPLPFTLFNDRYHRLTLNCGAYRDAAGRGNRRPDGVARQRTARSPWSSGHLPSTASAPRGRLRPQPAPYHRRAGPCRRPDDRRSSSRRPCLVPE